MVVVMPMKMSKEKVYTMKALGAKIVRTPNDKSFDNPQGMIAGAHRIASQMKNAVVLDQVRSGDSSAKLSCNKFQICSMGNGTNGMCSKFSKKVEVS